MLEARHGFPNLCVVRVNSLGLPPERQRLPEILRSFAGHGFDHEVLFLGTALLEVVHDLLGFGRKALRGTVAGIELDGALRMDHRLKRLTSRQGRLGLRGVPLAQAFGVFACNRLLLREEHGLAEHLGGFLVPTFLSQLFAKLAVSLRVYGRDGRRLSGVPHRHPDEAEGEEAVGERDTQGGPASAVPTIFTDDSATA